jgi:hypothetical protein
MNIKIFVFLFLFLDLKAAAVYSDPYTISGKVVDSKTGSAINYANVYIAYSMLGSSTNKNGEFLIQNVPNGNYQIIVSCIGYSSITAKIKISNSSRENLFFSLEPKVYTTEEVKVTGEGAERWQNNYELFKKAFIGESWRANETFIEDPYNINFVENDDELMAYTDYPIIIRNKALGYKITYHLESFSLNDNTTKYSGIPYFEKIQSKSTEEKLKWEENRKDAYLGSLRHFLTTICETDSNNITELENQGFYIVAQNNINTWFPPQPVELFLCLQKTDDENEMLLSFDDYWRVTYKPVEKGFRQRQQRSWIKLHGDSVTIDTKGRYYDQYKIETFGFWSCYRMAEMLPYDYEFKAKE